MQAGRVLDVKVAEALGYEVGKFPPDYYIVVDGEIEALPQFSTTWKGMGVLVEEAIKKQDVYLKLEADPHGGNEAGAWDEREWRNYGPMTSDSAPHAVCMAFLKAMRVTI
ncbi:hypothetical protein [Brevibacillus sp. FIR094]|uniref:hypothetical protein n=1 Tax=Brevibacillus sp. FIR094 TaxID=3134809 RepID=UPI003D192D33